MTTAIDRDQLTLSFNRYLPAPCEDAFEAWTDPEQLAEWWDPTGARLTRCEVDLRVGGAFVFENEGHSHPFTGTYRVLERPTKLVFDAMGALGTVLLQPEGEGTRMLVTIRCASAEHLEQLVALGVGENTARTLDNLVAHLR